MQNKKLKIKIKKFAGQGLVWLRPTPLRQSFEGQATYSLRTSRGSALIFTLLIIGLVASLAFYIGRSTVREARVVNANENTLGAYYVAEAGLEDGLARIAADHNIEVPTCYFGQPHKLAPTGPCDYTDLQSAPTGYGATGFNSNLSIADLAAGAPQSFPSRIRVASAAYSGTCGGSTFALHDTKDSTQCNNGNLNHAFGPAPHGDSLLGSPNDFIYDLRITSRTKSFGTVNASGDPVDASANTAAALPKDGVREFVLYQPNDPEAPDELRFYWTCDSGSCGVNDFLQLTIYRQPSANPLNETTTDVAIANLQSGPIHGGYTAYPVTNAVAPITKLRIKSNANSHISLAFFNATTNKYTYFKGDTARLQSIGYFAGVKRRLEADIDRRTGALLGLFDYAVYAGNALTQPQ